MEQETKKCTKCEQVFTLDCFYKTKLKNGKDYIQPKCKECMKEQNKVHRANLKKKEQEPESITEPESEPESEPEEEIFDPENSKKCTKCEKTKTINNENFCYRNGKALAQCRKCTNKAQAERKRNKEAEKFSEKVVNGEIKVPLDPNNFICNGCHLEKPKTEFRVNRKKCKDCEKKHGREYRRNDAGKQKAIDWAITNSARMTELQANWHQENKPKINKKYVQRYNSDFSFKLQVNLKSRIHYAFNNQNLCKSNRTIEYLNCSIPFLIEWFTKCFTGEMTLDNHGSLWHIDHVIPVNTFDLTNQNDIVLCFGWYNTMPLLGSENMSKHDKIVKTQIKAHIKRLEKLGEENKETPKIPQEYFDLCARHLN